MTKPQRAAFIAPACDHVLLTGSKISAVRVYPSESPPPATNTRPSSSFTAPASARTDFGDGPAAQPRVIVALAGAASTSRNSMVREANRRSIEAPRYKP